MSWRCWYLKGADNTPYEKIGDEVRSLADEVPFDIPDSWEWVRLGAVIELQSGQDMTPDKYNDCGKGVPYITGASNIENGNVLINRWTEYGRAFAYYGDILLTCKGTVGTMAVLQEPQVHIARQIMAIRPISESYVPYIQLVMDTLVENLKAAAKSMIPGIAREDVLQSLFPVPPVSEQKRIVQKISELSPWLEQYAAADTKLLSLNTAFPEALKKSILQEAVQGKLVPQDPSDEPAEALLERIRVEKQRLIKEGKIKKDKHESVIFRRDNSHYEKLDGVERCIDDELPFEIPESWAWVRLGNIGDWGSGATPSRTHPEYYDGSIPWLKTGDLTDSYITDIPEGISQLALEKTSVRLNESGSVLMAMYGATIGKLGILTYPATTNQACCACKPVYGVETLFLFYFLMSQRTAFIKRGEGGAQPNISKEKIVTTLMPLPPLAEQHRITQRIEELLPLVNGL